MPPQYNEPQQRLDGAAADFIFDDSQNFQRQQQQRCSLFGRITNSSNSSDGSSATFLRRDHGTPDEELAKEMNALSMNERDKVLEDVHGVADIHEESTTFLSECQHQLDLALTKVTSKSKRKEYDRAIFLMPSIASNFKFRLMFLRANEYDPTQSAKRMMKYFDDKSNLFGEECLTKSISIKDLSQQDLEVFKTGWILELPHKDQVGRPIFFFDATRYDFNNPKSMLRCAWYSFMVTIQRDEIAQQKGISAVVYTPGDMFSLPSNLKNIRNLSSKFKDIVFNLPVRITSYHICYDDPRMEFFLSTIRNFFPKQMRLRRKLHYGSDLELQYSLAAYGISCGILLQRTKTYNNHNNNSDREEEDAKRQLHKKYIDRRIEIERQEEIDRIEKESSSGVIQCPQPEDVLIGRGRPYQDYPGNLRYGQLIESNLDLYHKHIDKFSKTCLSMDIVKNVKAYGGRFIERTKEGKWKVIDDMKAREKTAISFRSRISKVTPDAVWNKTKASRARGSGVNHHSSQDDINAKRFRYA